MKKLMLGLAVAAVGSAFAVESSNIVGYNTFQCAANKYYLVAADFQSVSSVSSRINLQDFIKGDFVGTTSNTTAPEIQLWDPEAASGLGGYEHYYFFSSSQPSGETNFWGKNRVRNNVPTFKDTWITCGQSVWFRCQSACTITVAGQVVEVDTTVATLAGKYNLIANPFPTALRINDSTKIDWVGAGLVGTTSNTTAPEIQTWDPEAAAGLGGYTHYYFFSSSQPSGITNFWGTNRVKNNYNADLALPVGAGFWLKYSGNTDLTFTFKK